MMASHPLGHLATLRATGPDLDTFLQGQLSNDIRELTPARAQLTSLNSPKGRVLATMQLARMDDGIVMVMPASVADPVHRRMSMYILRSKVTIERAGDLPCSGLSGPGAGERIAELTGDEVPRSDWACASGNGIVAWRVPGTIERYCVVGAPGAPVEGDDAAWRLHDILAGIPEITPATQDLFVAQMLGLDSLGAINFNKGCYTGQEVIARAHYRGKVKRHAMTGRTDTDDALEPAMTLTDADGNAAATVVSAAPYPDRGQAVLAVLHRDYPPGTTLVAGNVVTVRF